MAVLGFDPAKLGTGVALISPAWESGTNSVATQNANAGAWSAAIGNVSQSTGKFYVEFCLIAWNGDVMVGLANASQSLNNYLGSNAATGFGLQTTGNQWGAGGSSGWTSAIAMDRVGLAVDVTGSKFWVRKNGGAWLSGDPVAGTGGGTHTITGPVFPAIAPFGATNLSNLGWTDAVAITGSTHSFNAAAPSGFTAWGDTSSYATPAQTFDPLWKATTTTLSGSNLIDTFANTTGTWLNQQATLQIGSAPYYFEVTLNNVSGSGAGSVGITPPSSPILGLPGFTAAYGLAYLTTGSVYNATALITSSAPTYTSADIVCVAVNPVLKKAWFRKNGGSWFGGTSPDPATGSGGLDITTTLARQGVVMPYVASLASGGPGAQVFTMNATAPVFPSPFPSAAGAMARAMVLA